MKKMLQLAATTLIVSTVILSLPLSADPLAPPLLAETATTTSPNSKETFNEDSFEDNLRFTLQHRLNDGTPLPRETVAIPFTKITTRPMVVLRTLKQSFTKLLKQQAKPLRINTIIDLLVPAEVTQKIGKLPVLSIQTNIDSNGVGESKLLIAAEKREVKDGALIDWKGLNGELTFADQFEPVTAQINFAGFTIDAPELFSLVWKNTTLHAVFDANLALVQMDLNLKALQGGDDNEKLNLQELAVKLDTKITPAGLELGTAIFKIGHFDFSNNLLNPSFDDLAITADGNEQNGNINYTVQTRISKLLLPYLAVDKNLDINYAGDLAFRNLDAEALLALQNTIRELSTDNPMAPMILLGKIIEIAPKILAKVPEIAIPKLELKTSNGNLQGSAHINLGGVTTLELESLMSALQAQANFTISKYLLEQTLTSVIHNSILNDMDTGANSKLSAEDSAVLQEEANLASKQQISMFVALKWLAEAGDNYNLIAELKDRKLTINGQELQIPYLSKPVQ